MTDVRVREICSACGADELATFLDLGQSPIADAYGETPDERVPRYPLRVAVCTSCWLVQLVDILSDLFGTGYSFYSSASPPLSAYHARYAEYLRRRWDALAQRGVLEVGCNDGDMLRHFADVPHLGVDPAKGPASEAMRRNLNVVMQPFSREMAGEILAEREPFGIVIANHVLAHVDDVADVLGGIADVLAFDGVAFIEVQYLPDLLLNNAFDLIYHEHANYFSLTSLESALNRHGLRVETVEFTERQGGSLRVLVRHAAGHSQAASRVTLDDEGWVREPSTYDAFQGRVEHVARRLIRMLYEAQAPIVGYGAPAKATTLLSYCDFDQDVISHVLDSTPAKQGRHMPGTSIPIIAPNTASLMNAQTVLLLAWNYTGHILRRDWGVMSRTPIIVPLPAPMIL